MSLKIVRNDITQMNTEAIVNTANENVAVGAGCDMAIYEAAGYDKLLRYRSDFIGKKSFGEVFVTPGFDLKARYIIHAVSPFYRNGESGEELLLRECYRKSLKVALEKGVSSIAFPLIGTGSYGYPKEEGLRIAVDEINEFLNDHEMEIYLVVFDSESTRLGSCIKSDLLSYVDRYFVERRWKEEYENEYAEERKETDFSRRRAFYSFLKAEESEDSADLDESDDLADLAKSEGMTGSEEVCFEAPLPSMSKPDKARKDNSRGGLQIPVRPSFLLNRDEQEKKRAQKASERVAGAPSPKISDASMPPKAEAISAKIPGAPSSKIPGASSPKVAGAPLPKIGGAPLPKFGKSQISTDLGLESDYDEAMEKLEKELALRMRHMADTFSEYLMFLIEHKNKKPADVYKKAIVDKKLFSKIKNNADYHPQKKTVLCLCIGAELNLDETRDLLSRAGYALSPCDKTDIIFTYFIENEIYDMIELDIQLEEFGLESIIA